MDFHLHFKSVASDKLGRRQVPGFRLIDNEGGEWWFEIEQAATKRFLAFLKVPKKYKPLLGLARAVDFFREVERVALKAIETYELKKSLSDDVVKTFGDLIDEL